MEDSDVLVIGQSLEVGDLGVQRSDNGGESVRRWWWRDWGRRGVAV